MKPLVCFPLWAALAVSHHSPGISADTPSPLLDSRAVPDCRCASDLQVSNTPQGLEVLVTQGPAGDCTPNCNDVQNCEGTAVNCCPTPGTASVRVIDWANFPGDLTIKVNGALMGTIAHLSPASIGNIPVGGNGVVCMGDKDHVEFIGDSLTIDVAGGPFIAISIKDVCKKCSG